MAIKENGCIQIRKQRESAGNERKEQALSTMMESKIKFEVNNREQHAGQVTN
jgi:hypothetical protein